MNFASIAKENGIAWNAGLPQKPYVLRPDYAMVPDDSQVFNEIMHPVQNLFRGRPPILFVYNYYEIATQLRAYGLRAYSMTVALSGSHLRGHLSNIPFGAGALGALVLLQKPSYPELFEAIETIAVGGALLIGDHNLPLAGEIVLAGMGFKKLNVFWNDQRIYRRKRKLAYSAAGSGFEAFNSKPVQKPYLVHRAILEAA